MILREWEKLLLGGHEACLVLSQAWQQPQWGPNLEIHKQYTNIHSNIWGGTSACFGCEDFIWLGTLSNAGARGKEGEGS